MPFCFECGDELKGSGKILLCNSCGWSSKNIKNIDKFVKPKSCPDCGKMGKTMKQCGICREAWFCSWCHVQRKRDLKNIFDKHNALRWVFQNSAGYSSGWNCFDGYRELRLIKSFDSYEPCLECAKKLIVKLTEEVLPKIQQEENSDEKDKQKVIDNFNRRRKRIQLALGFNKDEMFKSPLD